MHSKQIFYYFAVSESLIFTVFSNFITINVIKTINFNALPWPAYRALLDPLLILNIPSVWLKGFKLCLTITRKQQSLYLHFYWFSFKFKREYPFWEIFLKIDFCGRISLSLAFLLLIVTFVGGSRLELMYISLIRSGPFHLCGFQLLVLLPWLIEITNYFVPTE